MTVENCEGKKEQSREFLESYKRLWLTLKMGLFPFLANNFFLKWRKSHHQLQVNKSYRSAVASISNFSLPQQNMKNALLHQINMVIGKQNNHCVHALDTVNTTVMLLGRTSGVEFKQKFQLASRTSRYKNQLAPQIFY